MVRLAAAACLLSGSSAVKQAVAIPTVELAGGGGVQLPMLVMGDGAAWGRGTNWTEWVTLAGKGAGLDSAWDYGQMGGSPPNATGGTQTAIPPALAAAGVRREDVVITSKLPCGGFDGGLEPMTAAAAQQYIDANLAMLNTTYIDLLLLHHVCSSRAETAMVWREMEAAKRAGKARAIGVSNFVVADLEALAADTNLTEPIAANQCHFTVGQIDTAVIAYCKAHGIVLASYGTLHGPVPTNHPAIAAVAARRNVSEAAVVLKYVSAHGIAIVTASDSAAYDVEDAGIFGWELTADDMAQLDAVQGGQALTCSDCYAQPCRTCQEAIKAAGCGSFIPSYDHTGCMGCVANLSAVSMAQVRAAGCSDDYIFKACW